MQYWNLDSTRMEIGEDTINSKVLCNSQKHDQTWLVSENMSVLRGTSLKIFAVLYRQKYRQRVASWPSPACSETSGWLPGSWVDAVDFAHHSLTVTNMDYAVMDVYENLTAAWTFEFPGSNKRLVHSINPNKIKQMGWIIQKKDGSWTCLKAPTENN